MQPLFSAKNVTLHIKKNLLCENIFFDIFPGEIIGLIGPNGSGKTTLLHSIAQLHPPTHGDFYLHQKNIITYSKKQIAQHIAILFQETHCVFPQTVFEFCQSGRFPHTTTTKENIKIIDDALATMELLHKKNQRVDTLSGGEKKRLAIATSLAQTPTLFLLDEPTNHLDIKHKAQLLHHIKLLSTIQNKSFLIATHDLDMARNLCNRIFVIHQGILQQGNIDQILNKTAIANLFEINIELL